jgi:hypothetical protein
LLLNSRDVSPEHKIEARSVVAGMVIGAEMEKHENNITNMTSSLHW